MHRETELNYDSGRGPNVIWIFGDQHRAQCLGYRGDPNVHTPNIDNLARRGRHFDCAVSGAPWCAPFRGALLTGQYPHQNGVTKTPSPLDPSIPTVAAPFREAGYHTAWIGKWHLDGSNKRTHYVPPGRRGGFDYWLGYENNNNQYECYVHGTDQEEPIRLDGYETDALTDLFIGHLESHVGADPNYKPFFAALSVQPPHNPYLTPAGKNAGGGINPASVQLRPNVPQVSWVQEKARRDIAGYCGMVENLDWNVGRICDALKRLDLDRDTWIVFFSDHGDMLGSHAQWEKSSPWEESIRIPFIISHVSNDGGKLCGPCDAVINHVDIAPTTLGLCGLKAPGSMVGHDYSDNVIRRSRDGAVDSRAPEPDSAYLQQIPRKFHSLTVNKAWRGVAMRDGWKYVCTPGNDWLLHNTREDAYEEANYVHNSHFQQQRARCWDALKDWIEKTGDDFPLPERDLPV